MKHPSGVDGGWLKSVSEMCQPYQCSLPAEALKLIQFSGKPDRYSLEIQGKVQQIEKFVH